MTTVGDFLSIVKILLLVGVGFLKKKKKKKNQKTRKNNQPTTLVFLIKYVVLAFGKMKLGFIMPECEEAKQNQAG